MTIDSQNDEHLTQFSHPFQRINKSEQTVEYLQEQLEKILTSLKIPYTSGSSLQDLIFECVFELISRWKLRDAQSEIALKGLLVILETILLYHAVFHKCFAELVSELAYNTLHFWKVVTPFVFDSDLSRGTQHRNTLLFALTFYDVNTGKSRLQELYAAVPGIRNSLLGVPAKQFGERFHHLQKRLSRQSSSVSLASSEDDKSEDGRRSRSRDSSHHGDSDDDVINSGGLADGHYHQRVINVSNAPPVSLKKEGSGDWAIKQGSGGLVACVDPVMSKDSENVWLANLGMNVTPDKHRRTSMASTAENSPLTPATNTLGLPLIKQAMAEVFFHVLAEDYEPEPMSSGAQKNACLDMSLLGVLNNYNKGNYKLNPVIVQAEDYNVYYGGISNGLLWPALHNLPEYIVDYYNDDKVLEDHWCAYVRVNYQFAIDAVRNSRPQDFIWIHDYHLMLTGMIMQSLDPHLEVGFFLHIPFQPPDVFFTKYGVCGLAVLRGLLRFTKVGFQTHRDRAKYVELVSLHLKTAKVHYDEKLDKHNVTLDGWTCSLGVFPVSIKNDDFLKFVDLPETQIRKEKFRKTLMGENPAPDGKLFFSVERFDYTKGIKEKLLAYMRYLEKYPDRVGKDVFFQVAVTNRRSVDTYRMYQDECTDLADEVNRSFHSAERPEWKAIIFQTDGFPRNELVAAYLAMDIGVVTPKKDGMNLVAKEMLVCNPKAGLILSTGAGSEIQFTTAGLYHDNGEQNYHRVADLNDVESYADTFYKAATESDEITVAHGKRLKEFVIANNIERWSSAFLDPSWTHHVIRPTQVETLDDFFSLMMRTRNVRRQIVDRVLKGIPIRSHFAISLKNAKESLEQSCIKGGHTLVLKSTSDSPETAQFDIQNELAEFEKDLSFLRYVSSDDVDNVEQFVNSLTTSTAVPEEQFMEEVQKAVDLLYSVEHFLYFFTDRDGTLKSYACSYSSSIQPAYSGVIQAQFARRCAQTCCIVTTAPLMHIGLLDVSVIPPGYYYYGASGGREWYIDPDHKFKDETIPEKHLSLLDMAFSEVSHLLESKDFRPFTWIGSGLQKHFGHLTIAHQDVYRSVNAEKSARLFTEIEQIVKKVDPHGEVLTLMKTDLDIKILLKTRENGLSFDKGHGLKLLCEKMKCDLSEGSILVCGDSESDLPMLHECLRRNPQGVYTIWVTNQPNLTQKVKDLCASYNNTRLTFVSCPEVLLGAMAQATIRGINIRHC